MNYTTKGLMISCCLVTMTSFCAMEEDYIGGNWLATLKTVAEEAEQTKRAAMQWREALWQAAVCEAQQLEKEQEVLEQEEKRQEEAAIAQVHAASQEYTRIRNDAQSASLQEAYNALAPFQKQSEKVLRAEREAREIVAEKRDAQAEMKKVKKSHPLVEIELSPRYRAAEQHDKQKGLSMLEGSVDVLRVLLATDQKRFAQLSAFGKIKERAGKKILVVKKLHQKKIDELEKFGTDTLSRLEKKA